MLGSSLGGRDTAVEKIDKPTCLCRTYILVVGGRDGNLTDIVCQVVVSALERIEQGRGVVGGDGLPVILQRAWDPCLKSSGGLRALGL